MRLHDHNGWIVNLWNHIWDHAGWKIAGAFFLSVTSFLFDGILRDAMLAVLVLCTFDFITALVACHKTNCPIESRIAFRSAIKIAVYFLLISSGRVTEVATQNVLPFIDETVISFLAVTELISILENVGRMGYAIPKKLLNKLQEYGNAE
jgi:phage-related holin